MKLNLGCGRDKRKGYINCDLNKSVNPDKIVDLEKKLPFKDNSVEEIIASHVLEHINNFTRLMHEFNRICKNGAIIKINVPFYSSQGAFQHPEHKRFFTPFTFHLFSKEQLNVELSNKILFKIKEIRIKFGCRWKIVNKIIDPLINYKKNVYCRLFAWSFPASEIYFRLEVVK